MFREDRTFYKWMNRWTSSPSRGIIGYSPSGDDRRNPRKAAETAAQQGEVSVAAIIIKDEVHFETSSPETKRWARETIANGFDVRAGWWRDRATAAEKRGSRFERMRWNRVAKRDAGIAQRIRARR